MKKKYSFAERLQPTYSSLEAFCCSLEYSSKVTVDIWTAFALSHDRSANDLNSKQASRLL